MVRQVINFHKFKQMFKGSIKVLFSMFIFTILRWTGLKILKIDVQFCIAVYSLKMFAYLVETLCTSCLQEFFTHAKMHCL